ncbi:MAG TPA: 50S ribosomal protein L35 [Actinomycetota bacterium]|jgi:large subunit ribosomal protein L35
MPKMKTHRGAAKRFHVTGTGKIRRRRAFVNHILEKKSAKRKRGLRAPGATVSGADGKRVRRMLGE